VRSMRSIIFGFDGGLVSVCVIVVLEDGNIDIDVDCYEGDKERGELLLIPSIPSVVSRLRHTIISNPHRVIPHRLGSVTCQERQCRACRAHVQLSSKQTCCLTPWLLW